MPFVPLHNGVIKTGAASFWWIVFFLLSVIIYFLGIFAHIDAACGPMIDSRQC